MHSDAVHCVIYIYMYMLYVSPFKAFGSKIFPLSIASKSKKRSFSSARSVRRYVNTMVQHPLIAVCQMRSTADKVKNLQIVNQLTAEAKCKSAAVRSIRHNKHATRLIFATYHFGCVVGHVVTI